MGIPLNEHPEHVQQLVREASDEYWTWRAHFESCKEERALLRQKVMRLNGMGVGHKTIAKAFGIGTGTAQFLLRGTSKWGTDK